MKKVKGEKENEGLEDRKKGREGKGEREVGPLEKKTKAPAPGQARVGPPVRGGPLGSVLRNRYKMGI